MSYENVQPENYPEITNESETNTTPSPETMDYEVLLTRVSELEKVVQDIDKRLGDTIVALETTMRKIVSEVARL